ncbi:D-alanine--D-alanine ligase family protein [Tundrisphaera lichenicola]|uniref:D-alanine--D-alanine ligase family protein n=1 Tax=Tundrisphaera lichenicola TaxID=2029860 RepID=UPI003EB73720
MKIGIAFDLAPVAPALPLEGPDDRFEEFDKPETVEAIAEVIRGEGHEVVLLGDGRDFLEKVLADPPDFVFNIAEGEGVGRCREARVPAALEMLGIPYSGSDPLTLAACLDKSVAKRLVATESEVKFPRSWTFDDRRPGFSEVVLKGIFGEYNGLKPGGPASTLIFKPAFEGSSKGIRDRCIADDAEEAIAIYRRLIRDYRQPILAEEFISGDEVTVGVIGKYDRSPYAIGAMRIVPKQPDDRFVYSLEVKRDWRNRVSYEAPPDLPDPVVADLALDACYAYSALGCRDFARIDFRVRDGVPYFIEANPLPGLAPVTSDLVILAEGHGIGYADLIRMILHASLTRVGLS